MADVKTVNGLGYALVKTWRGLASANVKSINGVSASSSFQFAWITDVHVGRGGTFNPGQPLDTLDHIASTFPGIAFVVCSGDLTDHALESEMDDFVAMKAASGLAGKTWYILPGNHDELAGVDASGGTGGTPDWQYYDAAGYPRRWAFEYSGYKFIGFTAFIRRVPDPLNGAADVSSTDLTYVATELASRGSLIPWVFGHFPLSDTLGNNIKGTAQTTLLQLLGDYSCHVYAHGHRHIDYVNNLEDGVYHVNGECVAYSSPNTTGSFMIVTVDGLDITIDTYLRETAWGSQDTDSFSVTLPDTTPPTFSSAVIDTTGLILTITFNEDVEFGSGGNAGFALTASGGAASLTYSSGARSDELVYSISRPIVTGETVTLAYTQPGSGVEDLADNDLASFSGSSVTNNSTAVSPPTPDVLWWKSGSSTTITGTVGPNGTTNATVTTGPSGGYALSFDGTDDAASSNSAITPGSNVITISFWAKKNTQSGSKMIFELSEDGSAHAGTFEIALIGGTSDTFLNYFTGTTGVRWENGDISDTAWKYVTLIYDGSTSTGDIKVYVNASEQTLGTIQSDKTGTPNFGTYTLYMGARNNSSLFFSGFLADVRIYSSAINQAQITALYLAGAQ